ncbi:MAG: PAS domain S-box protein [Burkholderiales bacterium]|nr:PAS domain S-box protein [Burkholderiales bacterium]MBZ0248300.1 PAS domain S-box protein [Burkholderiales bacterium]MCL4690312.1 PAS domain S-box protein [Burkholderiales bacterium]
MTDFAIPYVDAFLLALVAAAVAVLAAAFLTLRRRQRALERANADLAAERDRIRFGLEGSSLTVWDWDVAADALWLSANWREILGGAPAETRCPIAEAYALVHPDDAGKLQESAVAVLKGATGSFDAEFRIRGDDGGWRWIRSRGKVTARDAAGRALRASGTNTDVTSRKLAERSLAESEARFRALTELSSDLYWEQDEHFHLVSWSAPAWTRWRDSSLPRPLLDAPELTEADWGAHRGVLEARQAFRDLEIHQVGADGREAWLSVGAVPVTDEQGKFRGYRGLARIITDRKLAEQRLRKSESQFRQLVEFLPAGVVLLDPDGRVVVHNQAFAQQLAIGQGAVAGKELREFLGEDRLATVQAHLRRALEGESTGYATRRADADGKLVDLEVLYRPLRGPDGDVEGVIALGIDVTRLKEADRMKDHFVSVVSHELRTPLTAMRGSLGLLAGGVAGEMPAEARPLVDIALQNSDRLWRLVNDLLDIEKMSAGHVDFRVQPLDWRPLLAEAVEASRGLMQQYDVGFELDPGKALRVRGDPDRLSQVLSNLILNAAKFSPPGGIVTVGAEPLPGGRVRTRIRDRGPGIPREFRARIFQPFSQAESGDSRRTGGTGLGLAISREIVTRLGGAIGFDDAPGGGTVFWFDLPEAPVAQ